MKKTPLLLVLLSLSLLARENPFFPMDDVEKLSYTSNSIEDVEPLKRAAISLPNTARRLKKVTIEYQNLDGAIEQKSIELDNEIDWHIPIFVSQNYAQSKEKKKVAEKKLSTHLFTFTNFTFYKKKIHIKTDDSLIRHYMLNDPQRVVMDFKRDSSFLTITRAINKSIFKTLVIGNHNGYYRCVLTLDGQYKYTLQENTNSLDLSFH